MRYGDVPIGAHWRFGEGCATWRKDIDGDRYVDEDGSVGGTLIDAENDDEEVELIHAQECPTCRRPF